MRPGAPIRICSWRPDPTPATHRVPRPEGGDSVGEKRRLDSDAAGGWRSSMVDLLAITILTIN